MICWGVATSRVVQSGLLILEESGAPSTAPVFSGGEGRSLSFPCFFMWEFSGRCEKHHGVADVRPDVRNLMVLLIFHLIFDRDDEVV